MVSPKKLEHRPSTLLAFLGGIVATVLFGALLHLAPAAGLALVDVPRLAGGLFVGGPEPAFWLGFALFLLGGVVLLPPALVLVWWYLPGAVDGLRGALVKGLVWGGLLWLLAGLVLPLLGALNRVDGVVHPGFFALELGWPTALGVLAAHLAYGVALAVVTATTRGVRPLDTLGWEGHARGDMREAALLGGQRRAFGTKGKPAYQPIDRGRA